MKILCTNHSLAVRGGTESYLETIAVELRRLEHEVILFSPECGAVADVFREQGFAVVDDPAAVPGDIDVIHGQHVDATAAVRARFRDVPLVFVSHSWFIPLEDPLGELGADAAVALNDLTEARLKARAGMHPDRVFRLRQPVSVSYGDTSRMPIGERARLAVSVSRGLKRREQQLREACEAAGIQLLSIGGAGAESTDARREMMAADIIFAMGRSAIEAMALGRAVFVVDEANVGGWVTEDSYPRLEGVGFTGVDAPALPALTDLLADYSPQLGTDARTLVARHHAAPLHAARLAQIYADVRGDTGGAGSGIDTVAELARENFALGLRVSALAWESAFRARENTELQGHLRALEEVAHAATARARQAETEVEALDEERSALVEERTRLLGELQGVTTSLSWKTTAPLRALRSRLPRPPRPESGDRASS